MCMMLKLEHISSGYGKKQVLFDVSLEVQKGDVVLLAGSNGSGKSTLLKAIYGLLPLWETDTPEGKRKGSIIFDGEDITGKPTSALLKKGLLYIAQKNNLFEDLTVKENLEMAGLALNDQQLLLQRMDKALETFSTLRPLLHRRPMKMSGGERQLLTLAMASLHEPKLILIDEPLIGLSGKNLGFVMENLKLLNERSGTTLVIVEHRVREMMGWMTRVVGMQLGEAINFSELNFFTNSL